MKKVLAVGIAICLLASLFAVSVNAADADTMSFIEISVAGGAAEIIADNDTQEIQFNINAVGMANSDIYGFEYLIKYDPTVFEPVLTGAKDVGAKGGALPNSWTHGFTKIAEGQLKYLTFNAANDVKAVDGVIATFKLKVIKKIAEAADVTAVKVILEDGCGSLTENEVNKDERTAEADGTVQLLSFSAVSTPIGLRGDLDGNGTVNLADIVMMRNWIMEGAPSADRIAKGDLDGNGQINLADIVALRNIIMGVAG